MISGSSTFRMGSPRKRLDSFIRRPVIADDEREAALSASSSDTAGMVSREKMKDQRNGSGNQQKVNQPANDVEGDPAYHPSHHEHDENTNPPHVPLLCLLGSANRRPLQFLEQGPRAQSGLYLVGVKFRRRCTPSLRVDDAHTSGCKPDVDESWRRILPARGTR